VAIVFTTSTSFISGTGLKSAPDKSFGRFTAVKSSVTEIEEVFEAKMRLFSRCRRATRTSSSFLQRSHDGFDDDVAIGQVFAFIVPFRRARISSFCCGVIPPFSTGRSENFASDFSIPAEALVEIFLFDFEHRDVESARRADLRYAGTHQAQPITPTFLISINSRSPAITRNQTNYYETDNATQSLFRTGSPGTPYHASRLAIAADVIKE